MSIFVILNTNTHFHSGPNKNKNIPDLRSLWLIVVSIIYYHNLHSVHYFISSSTKLLLNSMRKDHNETGLHQHLLAHVRVITTQYKDGLFPCKSKLILVNLHNTDSIAVGLPHSTVTLCLLSPLVAHLESADKRSYHRSVYYSAASPRSSVRVAIAVHDSSPSGHPGCAAGNQTRTTPSWSSSKK